MHLNAHEKPPASLRLIYKKYQKASLAQLVDDWDLVDFARGLNLAQDVAFTRRSWHNSLKLSKIFRNFTDQEEDCFFRAPSQVDDPVSRDVFESVHLPGTN